MLVDAYEVEVEDVVLLNGIEVDGVVKVVEFIDVISVVVVCWDVVWTKDHAIVG